ncbi:MAG: hypothetical protein AAFO69_08170, partial [Bacteroidota bacterium]
LAFFDADGQVNISELKQHIISKLPIYMLPSGLYQVDQLPRAKTGKIDEKVLLTSGATKTQES